MLSLSRLFRRKKMVYECLGRCPVCQRDTTFHSKSDWLRDGLVCANCRSIPRERAFAWALDTFCPDWRSKVIHESSPAERLVSNRMRKECPGYIGSQYFPDIPVGQIHQGYRSENLEQLSFADATIDIHCHLDVLEHVNHPSACFAEMARTLRPGGRMIFTTPIYEGKVATERRAEYRPEGVMHLADPEYHGNPISDKGALVTFHYGADFADLILEWAKGCSVNMITLNDPALGILGKFREVFVVTRQH